MKNIVILLVLTSICFANEPLKPTPVSVPPIIDGQLDEWKNIFAVETFKTFSPDFGKDASQKTIAFASYDSENIYFAFRCYDAEPDKIKSNVSNRDNINSDDWVCINLDSFSDKQSLYAFYINPKGIQMDSRFAAGQEDFSADFVWYSAGKINEDGYSVEIAIPLKSLRYSDADPVIMSVFFERHISRLAEHSSYPELDPKMGFAFLVQMKPMEYHGLKSYKLFEILPAVTYSQKYSQSKNDFIRTSNKGELSITTKYGITSDLVIDGTYNPDFSQVEADAGQVDVNLRSALYYPEKRPFFLEGSEIFNIAGTSISNVDPLSSLVHTRNIITPLAGIKLSGKIDSKNTLAVLYSADELPEENSQWDGDYAHFAVLRYKRALSSDSYLGGIYTSKELKNSFNRVGGIDGMIRTSQSSTIEWNAIYAGTKFYAEQDPLLSSAISIKYKNDTRDLYYDFSVKNISQDFYTMTGYITRNGIFTGAALVRPKFYPSAKEISRIDLEAFSAQTQDKPSRLWETFNHVSAQVYFFGSLTAKLRYTYSTEIYNSQRFETGGLFFGFSGQLLKQFFISTTYSNMKSIYYSAQPYQGKSDRVTAVAVFNPTENFELYTQFVFYNFTRSSDKKLIYEYPIFRERVTYQFNKYLFLRGIVEYNKFRRSLLTDFLVSFTYVPGTVIHVGYGSLYERTTWDEFQNRYVENDNFREAQRGLFLKMSYLWRM